MHKHTSVFGEQWLQYLHPDSKAEFCLGHLQLLAAGFRIAARLLLLLSKT